MLITNLFQGMIKNMHLFYITLLAGYCVPLKKECESRGGKLIGKFIDIFVDNTCCVDVDCARSAGLPTHKIEEKECYAGLKYPSKEFFCFVCAIDFMFCSVLTDEIFTIFGSLCHSFFMTEKT